MSKRCDILIVGGGIIGLSVARELARRGVKRIAVLEKERGLGFHASGKNSGVIHAGLYYAADSLKARFCARGANALKDFASQKGIPLLKTGKVLVAARRQDLPELDHLLERAQRNGIRAEKINEERLRQIEPEARTLGWALYSPETAVVDPHLVLAALATDLEQAGVEIAYSESACWIGSKEKSVKTTQNEYSYGHLINTAGLHADRFAHQMGVGRQYRILPFRGGYRKLTPRASALIRGLIYPIPDARLPFLGVHLTKSPNGEVWVGPTAEPAFGREHYGGLDGVVWSELPHLILDLFWMIIRNSSGLASHIAEEIKKKLPGGLLRASQRLVPGLCSSDFTAQKKTGLRAQLIDVRKMRLVMDFLVEKGPASTHVLNAVSPGFTASFAFAEYVADLALDKQPDIMY